MINDQEFQQLYERVIKLEEEFAHFQKRSANIDWEAKVIEQIKRGDMHSAVNIYREHGNRQASLLEAVNHVMEIKRKIGR